MGYIEDIRKHIGHAPMLSAGATVAIIKDGRILLNLRSDTGTWGIPGGAIELGEALEQTAVRELKEETNLEVDNLVFLHLFSGNDFYFRYPNGDELYAVVALYLAQDVKGEMKIADDESYELRYFSKDEIPELEPRTGKIIEWLIDKGLI